VLTWYASTNDHRPVADFEMLLSEDVEMRYPNKEEPFTGRAAFRKWYDEVLKIFFDETHEVESWDIKIDGNRAVAVVIVRWEARAWPVGAARSQYQASLSRQRFEIERAPGDGRVYIQKKIAETFEKTAPLYGVGA
jgi:hypothetical protein